MAINHLTEDVFFFLFADGGGFFVWNNVQLLALLSTHCCDAACVRSVVLYRDEVFIFFLGGLTPCLVNK